MESITNISLKRKIIDSSEDFQKYLSNDILGGETYNLFLEIMGDSHGYLLSGLIRDYFLMLHRSVRDLDFVFQISKLNLLKYKEFLKKKNISFNYNSFKGLKIKSSEFPDIDIWKLENTWGIKHQNLKPTVNSLIDSVFFNFSAIAFDLQGKKFIFNDHFINFLSTKYLDIVYPENPNIPLCLFNICYYTESLELDISENVKAWVKSNYTADLDFDQVQMKHLGKIQYTSNYINTFLKKIQDGK
ncbi:MAG: hypothetical protein HDS62_06375 [Bacteroidales bacterium]|nr:hypothetical protein [Bacteroidales bacterium]